jgi:hypothetical protein
MGRDLRFNLWFVRNAFLIDEKFFIPFHADTREPPLEVRKDDTLIPNLPVATELRPSSASPCQWLHSRS